MSRPRDRGTTLKALIETLHANGKSVDQIVQITGACDSYAYAVIARLNGVGKLEDRPAADCRLHLTMILKAHGKGFPAYRLTAGYRVAA